MTDSSIHPVLRLIHERYRRKSKPGRRDDGQKLALAIEGGGMRGVVSCAMAAALHFLDLVDVFDVVYGSSAGVYAGSFFVTGKMPLGPTIYYDDLNNSKFIDLKRLFIPGKSVMDLGFLLDEVLTHNKPLNWRAVVESPIPLRIIVSSVRERRPKVFGDYKSREDLFTLLKACATIPFVAGPPVEYEDDLIFDSSLYVSIPHQIAWAEGCTHVLVLRTRPEGRYRSQPSVFEKAVLARRLDKLEPGLGADYLARAEEYRSEVESVESATARWDSAPYAYSITPPTGAGEVRRLTKSRAELVTGAAAGMDAAMRTFIRDEDIRYFEVIYPANRLGHIPVVKT